MRKLFFSLLFTINCVYSLAQPGGNPFSMSPFGDLFNNSNPTQNVIGGSNANRDSTFLNLSNPASYSSLAFGQPLFATSIGARLSKVSENGSKVSYHNMQIEQLAFGLSFGKRFGIAVGFKPYSEKDYSIYTNQAIGTDSVFYNYSGNGAVQSFQAGLSCKVMNYKGYKVSLGIQGSYLFGIFNDVQLSSLSRKIVGGGVSQTNNQYKDVLPQFGMQASKTMKNHRIDLGATYIPTTNINSFRTDSLYYTSNFIYHTNKLLISSESMKGTVSRPSTLGFGLAYHFEPQTDTNFTNKLLYKFSVFFDYESTAWSQYKENFTTSNATSTFTYKNTTRMNLGVEFTPHRNIFDKSTAIPYFAKVKYRIGVQTATLPFSLGTTQVSDKSVAIGFGFPITSQRSISNINIGLRYGSRGNNIANGLREDYWLINFGILLAPGKNDKWFRKYQYD
jgi:hypothetical protein